MVSQVLPISTTRAGKKHHKEKMNQYICCWFSDSSISLHSKQKIKLFVIKYRKRASYIKPKLNKGSILNQGVVRNSRST